jgi:RNA polymerase sigma factor (sigma-70 family)
MQNVDAVDVSGGGTQLVDLDDATLLAMARSGHREAYATLFSRYAYAAHRLARHLGQKDDSDDVVSEAFAQVLDLLGRGKGPETAFRAYLFTTVRHECGRRAKARKRVTPTDDLRQIDSTVELGNGQLDGFERSAIRAAYESLPARWRTVLWHLDVEGRKPHELGPLLDLSANSVSALVYRARAGLREAYLQQHVRQEQPGDSRTCAEHRAKLSAFVRRTASARDQERIHTHLESCGDCMAVYLDLQEVNRDVGSTSAPVATLGVVGLALGAHVSVLLKAVAALLVPPAVAVLASSSLVGGGSAVTDAPSDVVASASPAGTGTGTGAGTGAGADGDGAALDVGPSRLAASVGPVGLVLDGTDGPGGAFSLRIGR